MRLSEGVAKYATAAVHRLLDDEATAKWLLPACGECSAQQQKERQQGMRDFIAARLAADSVLQGERYVHDAIMVSRFFDLSCRSYL